MKSALSLRRVGLALLAPAVAVVISFTLSAIVLAAIGKSHALVAFFDLGDTPRQQVNSVVTALNRAIPLFLAGIAVSVGFRMGLFNIGVEGQYRMATVLAAALGAVTPLPGPLNILLIIVVAMLTGAAWAAVPAVLKVTRGVSEVISTIMLNFVAVGLAAYLLQGPFKDPDLPPGGNVYTRTLPEDSWLPDLNGLLVAFGLPEPRIRLYGFLVIAVIVGAAVAFLLSRTRFGFDLRATGLSPTAALTAGVDARAMTVRVMLLSGALAGLIGLPELLGKTHAYGTSFTAGLGFTGIAVALLGRNTVTGIALGALLFGFLDRASIPLQFQGVPPSVVTIMQGLIVLSVVIANEVVRRLALARAERVTAEGKTTVTAEVAA
ncbi:sugar ABC transporter permease [Carbonactinospora thermoautotrophica]|uniref:ABC-type transporter n=1 Tax=Carbonactinospora thermoautotrophica TaxID=1469144 RepID=A0A132MXP5_9ACTN|nr:ABC transporter permease [Carbonactinospora thermoautotrophica]KWX02470.1 ABC-type transporter [Carbonactinospora thermoautotrophica]KWX03587.1 sugar ABC transporter permease [Carbonactinospora thermoautotrophica]KWX08906.1 sugar ABC transporter permease [Carbonactinospora thermoautotrophica]